MDIWKVFLFHIVLLPYLLFVKKGDIFIDNEPMHHYNREEIFRIFSYGMQEVFLFSNTIASNIAMYHPECDEEQIVRCGQLAEVDEFAALFPDGYDTIIGEKGFGLSGGQKQRVEIFLNFQYLLPINFCIISI